MRDKFNEPVSGTSSMNSTLIENPTKKLFRFILREYVGCQGHQFYWSVELLRTDLQIFLAEAGGMAGEW